MKNNYYDPKQIKPNTIMKFKLRPRENGKNYFMRKRGEKIMQKFIPIHTGCQYYDKDNKKCSRDGKGCHLLTPCILQRKQLFHLTYIRRKEKRL
ncbi:hypothetical protein [Methanobrevibacter sp.]|uniref:hypothetical protein n=1 Tax=Methanobrevibacter sp. TaxID=66852 RepID=UPI00388F9764